MVKISSIIPGAKCARNKIALSKLCHLQLIFILFFPIESKSYWGLGIIIGEPTGISSKYVLGNSNMLHGALSFSLGDKNSIYLHGDYLWRNFGIIAAADLAVYYGLGAKIKLSGENKRKGTGSSTKLALRVPIGMNYVFPSAPFDIFAEIIPIVNLVPNIDIGVKIAIGGRYLFR